MGIVIELGKGGACITLLTLTKMLILVTRYQVYLKHARPHIQKQRTFFRKAILGMQCFKRLQQLTLNQLKRWRVNYVKIGILLKILPVVVLVIFLVFLVLVN